MTRTALTMEANNGPQIVYTAFIKGLSGMANYF